MSNYTQMPPSLSERWVFPEWDIENDLFPPWEYGRFWYHDIDGEGKYLVFIWCESFDDWDRLGISGHIYRIKEMQKAVDFCARFRGCNLYERSGFVLDCSLGDGIFLRIPWTVFGEELSYHEIKGRWRE